MEIAKVKIYRMFILLGLFAVAMGVLEASVVVYLRELYYPGGFDFPLRAMPPGILSVEVTREICTIVMLATIAVIAGKNKLQRLAWFIYCFGVWDIIYYVSLKVFLDWPSSLLTWDLLFLIPVPWVGPVLALVICSITMILLAAGIVVNQERGWEVRLKLTEWVLLCGGAFIIFISMVWDYYRVLIREGLLGNFFDLFRNYRFQPVMARYIPGYFVWPVFIVGEVIILLGIALLMKRVTTIHCQKR